MTYHKPKGFKVPQTDKFKAIAALEEIIVKFGHSYVDEYGHVVLQEGWSFARLLSTLQREGGETYGGYASPGGLYNLCVEVFGKPRPQGWKPPEPTKPKTELDPTTAMFRKHYIEDAKLVSNTELNNRVHSMACSMVTFDRRLHAFEEVNKHLEETLRQAYAQISYLRKVLADEVSQRRAVQQRLNDFLTEWDKETLPLEELGPRLATIK
jgi:hypothetical protein